MEEISDLDLARARMRDAQRIQREFVQSELKLGATFLAFAFTEQDMGEYYGEKRSLLHLRQVIDGIHDAMYRIVDLSEAERNAIEAQIQLFEDGIKKVLGTSRRFFSTHD